MYPNFGQTESCKFQKCVQFLSRYPANFYVLQMFNIAFECFPPNIIFANDLIAPIIFPGACQYKTQTFASYVAKQHPLHRKQSRGWLIYRAVNASDKIQASVLLRPFRLRETLAEQRVSSSTLTSSRVFITVIVGDRKPRVSFSPPSNIFEGYRKKGRKRERKDAARNAPPHDLIHFDRTERADRGV